MEQRFAAVIMAGGRGTRFWPVSTSGMPKQFLKLTGDRTMLQQTADRFQGLCGRDSVLVVTGREYGDTVMEQLPWLDRENLLLEPSGRNTAPCIGWAAATLIERGLGSSLMVVVPSDHVIDSPEGFRETVRLAAGPAAEGRLVTIGIPPDRPATGFGYLHAGRPCGDDVSRVISFTEKPDSATASRYLASGEYLWNAGMFIWRPDEIMNEISAHLPRLARGLQGLGKETTPDPEVYCSLESVSVDYGIMEKAEDVVVVPARFGWNDIGDWPSARECGVGRGEVLSMDSGNTTVWNPGKLTVLMGLSNVSVVETEKVTLVMSDEYSQRLREIVAELEKSDPDLV
ncbi:MAG: mannose-1-phosphate guanylyltransferase [Candidatus Aegiribacteria sp.]